MDGVGGGYKNGIKNCYLKSISMKKIFKIFFVLYCEDYRKKKMVNPMNVWSGKLLSEAKFGHVIIVGGIVKPNPIK